MQQITLDTGISLPNLGHLRNVFDCLCVEHGSPACYLTMRSVQLYYLQRKAVTMSSNFSRLDDAENILRVLYGQLKRKREGIRGVVEEIGSLSLAGQIPATVAKSLQDRLLELVRREDELTEAEREILDRDTKLEHCLRHHFPSMPDHLVVVSICIIDGLSTAQIASIVFKSTKAVDHYRQEIRHIVGLQGDRSSLHRHLTNIVRSCPTCHQ